MIAQGPPATPPDVQLINQSDDPLLKPFRWRSIGPAVMSGRVDDIEIVESNPSIIYLGYATGGALENQSTTAQPGPRSSTRIRVSSIGDIGLSQSNPDVIYVGTGEPNNRQSSSFGAGIYKSTDGGKKFEYVGLKETQSIAPDRRSSQGSEHRIRGRSRTPVWPESRNAASTRPPTAGRPG